MGGFLGLSRRCLRQPVSDCKQLGGGGAAVLSLCTIGQRLLPRTALPSLLACLTGLPIYHGPTGLGVDRLYIFIRSLHTQGFLHSLQVEMKPTLPSGFKLSVS